MSFLGKIQNRDPVISRGLTRDVPLGRFGVTFQISYGLILRIYVMLVDKLRKKLPPGLTATPRLASEGFQPDVIVTPGNAAVRAGATHAFSRFCRLGQIVMSGNTESEV
jgi:hypothetical protein